jgi:hypothetical protein
MDEPQWRDSRDPRNLVRFLLHAGGRGMPHRVATDRSLRLLMVALWRRMTWPWGGTAPEMAAIRQAERAADGDAGAEVIGAGWAAGSVAVATLACSPRPAQAVLQVFDHLPVFLDETSKQAGIVRDIFGNPFRPTAFDPAWRTSPALALAKGMYDDRRFDDLPLLADALEEAGCSDEEILGHCRGPGPHARGCWVLDLILGKA